MLHIILPTGVTRPVGHTPHTHLHTHSRDKAHTCSSPVCQHSWYTLTHRHTDSDTHTHTHTHTNTHTRTHNTYTHRGQATSSQAAHNAAVGSIAAGRSPSSAGAAAAGNALGAGAAGAAVAAVAAAASSPASARTAAAEAAAAAAAAAGGSDGARVRTGTPWTVASQSWAGGTAAWADTAQITLQDNATQGPATQQLFNTQGLTTHTAPAALAAAQQARAPSQPHTPATQFRTQQHGSVIPFQRDTHATITQHQLGLSADAPPTHTVRKLLTKE